MSKDLDVEKTVIRKLSIFSWIFFFRDNKNLFFCRLLISYLKKMRMNFSNISSI